MANVLKMWPKLARRRYFSNRSGIAECVGRFFRWLSFPFGFYLAKFAVICSSLPKQQMETCGVAYLKKWQLYLHVAQIGEEHQELLKQASQKDLTRFKDQIKLDSYPFGVQNSKRQGICSGSNCAGTGLPVGVAASPVDRVAGQSRLFWPLASPPRPTVEML